MMAITTIRITAEAAIKIEMKEMTFVKIENGMIGPIVVINLMTTDRKIPATIDDKILSADDLPRDKLITKMKIVAFAETSNLWGHATLATVANFRTTAMAGQGEEEEEEFVVCLNKALVTTGRAADILTPTTGEGIVVEEEEEMKGATERRHLCRTALLALQLPMTDPAAAATPARASALTIVTTSRAVLAMSANIRTTFKPLRGTKGVCVFGGQSRLSVVFARLGQIGN